MTILIIIITSHRRVSAYRYIFRWILSGLIGFERFTSKIQNARMPLKTLHNLPNPPHTPPHPSKRLPDGRAALLTPFKSLTK